jgi:hypothetical protein
LSIHGRKFGKRSENAMGKLWLTAGCIVFSLCSCASVQHIALIVPNEKPQEIVISKELGAFLKERPQPTVVLRVPSAPTSVTEAEQKRLQQGEKSAQSLQEAIANAYNDIEKELIKAGFTVRDRALLNSLLAQGNVDYEEIGKKVKTDLIIEITALNFSIYEKVTEYIDKETNEKGSLFLPVSVQSAEFSFKIVIVDKGQLGGMFAFNYQPYLSNKFENDFDLWQENGIISRRGKNVWYSEFIFSASSKEAIQFFAKKLMEILNRKTA